MLLQPAAWDPSRNAVTVESVPMEGGGELDDLHGMHELGSSDPFAHGTAPIDRDAVDLDVHYKRHTKAGPLKSHELANTWWLVTRGGATDEEPQSKGQMRLEGAGRMWTTWGLGEWGLVEMSEDGQMVCTMVLGTTQYQATLPQRGDHPNLCGHFLSPRFASWTATRWEALSQRKRWPMDRLLKVHFFGRQWCIATRGSKRARHQPFGGCLAACGGGVGSTWSSNC